MRKICVVVGSRANYSSIKSAMRAIQGHPELELQLVVGASAVLDRFGSVVDVITADGFEPRARVYMLIEGDTPVTMARSTGLGLLELPTVFQQLAPDFVVTVGDRFETMATAIAAAFMNIPLAHTMGGEVSGTIDESIRHAITKLAHVHFPANLGAAQRIVQLGEDPERIFVVGCPRIDLVAEIARTPLTKPDRSWLGAEGVGAAFDPDRPFLLVSQHPVTTEYGAGESQVSVTLQALSSLGLPAIMLWPNADAGSEDLARGIRKFREKCGDAPIRYYKNIPVATYIRLLARCACMVGNSSSALREGPFLGVPAVNVGSRQSGRERGKNVIDADHQLDQLISAIRRQLEHGRYSSEPIYGDGRAGERIADVLARVTVGLQKRHLDAPPGRRLALPQVLMPLPHAA